MAPLKAFLAVAAMTAIIIDLATAANITVGATGGSWDLSTNLASWASSQTFNQGDNLIFSYDSSTHDVLEVNKANYDSCITSSPMNKHTSGNDMIPLSMGGERYFICGTAGHCQGGMKVEINTVAASSPSPIGSLSPPTSSPSPTKSSSPPLSSPSPTGSSSPPPAGTSRTTPAPHTGTPPPPPGSSGTVDHGLRAKAAIGFGFGLGMLMLLAH